MATTTTAYAISGAETKYFEVMFWNGVTEKRQEGKALIPIRGSIGVFWQLYQDLTVIGTQTLTSQKVNKVYPRKPEDGVPMTAINARALKAFFDFAQQTQQPFFFIKKGTQPLWLVRKTSAYYYDDRPDEPYWYPHRIQFEFVRSAEGSETAKRMGKGMNTMVPIEIFTPLPKPVELPLVEMPPKKAVKEPDAPKETPKETPQEKPKGKPKLVRKKATGTTAVTTVPIKPTKVKTIKAPYKETEEEPLDLSTTEIIKVQSFEHDGTLYYREPIKNKLYKRKANGSVGPYVGRWSPKEQALNEEIPDSDRED
jgi:hypothetical protein